MAIQLITYASGVGFKLQSNGNLTLNGNDETGANPNNVGGLQIGSLTSAGVAGNSFISAPFATAGPSAAGQHGSIQVIAGGVVGSDPTTFSSFNDATAFLAAGSSDKCGAAATINGGNVGGCYVFNFSTNALASLNSGTVWGSCSISGANSGTSVTAGETITLSIAGESTKTITLALNSTGANIAADIQAKIRALTADSGGNQFMYSGASVYYNLPRTSTNVSNSYLIMIPGDQINGIPSTIVINGGTAASALKLGLSNGGIEFIGGVGGPVNLSVGDQGLTGLVNPNPINIQYGGYSNDNGGYQLLFNWVPQFNGTQQTGSGTPTLGSNCPAITLAAPTTWVKIYLNNGQAGWMPLWV